MIYVTLAMFYQHQLPQTAIDSLVYRSSESDSKDLDLDLTDVDSDSEGTSASPLFKSSF